MASILKEYGPQGLRVVALSVERKDTAEKVAKWMKQYGGEGLETGAADAEAADKLHKLVGVDFQSIPSAVFVSAKGAVKSVQGPGSRAEVVEAVDTILPTKEK